MVRIILILLSISLCQKELFCQDSLCYSQINQLAAEYKKEKYGFRINGEFPGKGKFREFYVTDSTVEILHAVHVTVWDQNNISESTGFYFNNGDLMLVEIFRFNGNTKSNMEFHYFLRGNCYQQAYEMQDIFKQLYFLRVANVYKLNFKNVKNNEF